MKWNLGPWRRWLIVPPVFVGVAITALLALNREAPKRKRLPEEARSLRVIVAAESPIVPAVLGYGTARPATVWRGVAEIKGRLISIHQDLRDGSIVSKGTELLAIDDKEYVLATRQLEATIEKVRGQIREQDAQRVNLEASLSIEKDSLNLAEQAFSRTNDLSKTGRSSQAELDRDQREVLAQKKSVQSVENSLRLIPAQIETLRATLRIHEADLATAKLQVEKARIRAPFDCRIADVRVEKDQFVAVGEVMFEAQGLAAAEVEAKLGVGEIRRLLAPGKRETFSPSLGMAAMRELFDIDAEVRVQVGARSVSWSASFDRVRELVDARTRTLGIVVKVDQPYENVVPGERPPLVKGMYCAVTLRTKKASRGFVVPRSALHGRAVLTLDAENRLQRTPVEIAFSQADYVVIKAGLAAGVQVVVSDPTPAIVGDVAAGQSGQLVAPVVDAGLSARLRSEAGGGKRAR